MTRIHPRKVWDALASRIARRRVHRRLAGHGPAGAALAGALQALSGGPVSPWFEKIEARRDALARRDDAIPRWGRPWLPNRQELVPDFDPSAAEPLPISRALEASKEPKWCRVLYELARCLRPRYVVEIGTNLGISGCYLAAGLEEAGGGALVTLEGSPDKAAIARESFEALGFSRNVEVVVGDFGDTVDGVLARLGAEIDLAFIDGFHQREATIAFHEGFVRTVERGILVYDDIRWSSGMREAWDRIRSDDRVATSVDAHWVGLVEIPRGSRTPLHVEWPLP